MTPYERRDLIILAVVLAAVLGPIVVLSYQWGRDFVWWTLTIMFEIAMWKPYWVFMLIPLLVGLPVFIVLFMDVTRDMKRGVK